MSIQDDLARQRQLYPTPMTDAQRGELLNTVAWTNRAEGWGLLAKPSGAHVPQPKTGTLVAGDILFNKATGHHYDVLADGEGAGTPEWIDDGLMDTSRWVAPVAPDQHSPAPPTKPPKSNDPSLSDLVQALAAMEDQIAEILLTVKMIGNTPAPIYRTTIDPFNIPVVLHPDPPQEAQS